MTNVKLSNPKKKLTKGSNSEKKSIKRIPQVEWLLIVGGSEEKRRKIAMEPVVTFVEKKDPPIHKMYKDESKLPKKEKQILTYFVEIPLKGFNAEKQEKLLFGNSVDNNVGMSWLTSGYPFLWLSRAASNAELLNLFGADCVLYLSNLNCDKVGLLQTFLESVKLSEEKRDLHRDEVLGRLVIGLKSKEDL